MKAARFINWIPVERFLPHYNGRYLITLSENYREKHSELSEAVTCIEDITTYPAEFIRGTDGYAWVVYDEGGSTTIQGNANGYGATVKAWANYPDPMVQNENCVRIEKIKAGGAKLCPFCGGEEIVAWQYHTAVGKRWKIVCTGCMAEVDPGYAQEYGVALALWNKRKGEENMDGKTSINEKLAGLTTEQAKALARDLNSAYQDGATQEQELELEDGE